MSDHCYCKTIKCSCGNIIQQCRCMASGRLNVLWDKMVITVENGCLTCKAKDEPETPTVYRGE